MKINPLCSAILVTREGRAKVVPDACGHVLIDHSRSGTTKAYRLQGSVFPFRVYLEIDYPLNPKGKLEWFEVMLDEYKQGKA